MSSKIFALLIEDLREINKFVDDSYRKVVEGENGGYSDFQIELKRRTISIERLCKILLEENAEIMSNMEQAHRALKDATYHDFMVRRNGPLIEPFDVMIIGKEKIKIDMLHKHVLALMEEGFNSFRCYLEKKDDQ